MAARQTYRILLADADRDRMLVVREALDELPRLNTEIRTVTTAPALIGLLKAENFDLVIAADDLPRCHGAELLRWMKVQVRQVPIVLIAPKWNLADQEEKYAAAADLLDHGELIAPILDRAVRYAVSGHDRHAMTLSVLENTDSIIAVIDRENRVKLANSAFWSLAAEAAASAGTFQTDVLLAKVLRNQTGEIRVGERILKSRIVDLPHNYRSIVLLDVTRHAMALAERRDTERRITHLATHDSLTGLPNRLGFSGEINKRIRAAKLEGKEFYLVTFDLKRFKEINDVFGHATGDGLLKSVAERMRGSLRENEYLARLGGDEFVALQPKNGDDDTLPCIVRRILKACDQSFTVKKKLINVSLSAGISIYPAHGQTAEELQANAACAIGRIKRNPLERVCTFDESMDRALRKRRILAADLQQALEDRAIEVHFQPKARVRDCRLTGFEALARWTHPQLGPISPVEFISIAEEYGMIIELGRCLMEKACSIARSWPDDLHLAINVSPVQIIHTDLVETVRETLMATGLNPKRLEIEITESLLIGDTERTLEVLRKLRAMDISIAMDDFGTGYSSLSALMAFPFDTLKIDRTFIEKITHNPQAYEIVRSVIGLGRMMDFKVVAEGVDMQSHIDFLREHGCSEMQGFLLGKPAPADKIAALIADGPILKTLESPLHTSKAA
ncbi:putative bifunctional diguanylate cyclase/phosphodiesterase [Notoacmeibacter ruber]|uniref:EAL domain-containing protein n=1 Tax=Notoacmeibacter ruber TaxID=2670375 RepID=A0A3L7JDL7_9HYPH|nr:GGDEF domain-containing response regulator [Notoacmeibacter ruber]RLQ88766.1 EAL domain-containing protein [Notoacmeibacter ruber]